MNDFKTLATNRQSCRSFSGESIDKKTCLELLDIARFSPSACNGQPWHFVIVTQDEKKQALANHLQAFNKDAGAFIVLIEEKNVLAVKAANVIKHQNLEQLDLGIATAHIVLAAADQGIASCILGWFSEKPIKMLLEIPKNKRVRLVIALGKAKEEAVRQKKRKSLEDITTIIDS